MFGWQFSKDDNISIEYWRITTGGSRGGLLKRTAQTPPDGYGTNAFVCSLEVADFDRTSDRIIEHGGEIAIPKFAIPGVCWHGYFKDTENNIFGIFQVMNTV